MKRSIEVEDTQLTLASETAVAVAEPQPEVNLLAVIARAAADERVDVQKMQALLNMKKDIDADNQRVEFMAALSRIQPRMPRVEKHGKIEVQGQVRSRFARYEDVDKSIRPLLAEEGFSADFDTEMVGSSVKIILKVGHRAGHSEQRTITLPLDTSGSKNGVQGVGSTVSYGKRYLICNFFNIITVEEDDDGMGGCISTDQQIVINDLLKETNADVVKFLKFMGASAVDAIPASQYQRAVSALERKKK